MAKKKADPVDDTPAAPGDDVAAAIAAVQKDYGVKTVSGQTVIDRHRQVIPFSPAVDPILGGGIAEGSWVTMSSAEGFGKTSASLTFAATCQRPEYGARPIFYYPAEGRLKRRDLRGIKGLDPTPGRFNVVESERGRILSSADYLKVCGEYITRVPGSVHIIDSVSALVNPKVLQEGLGTEDRGAGYKIVAQFCDLYQAVVPANNCIVIGIVHLIANTGGVGAGKVPKVPNRWRYQTDVWLDGKWSEAWRVGADDDSEQIGQKLHWTTRKTALEVGPGGKCTSYLRYGTGIDRTYELLVFAKDVGLVVASGSWLSLAFLAGRADLLQNTPFAGKDEVKVQGMEKAYRALEEYPAWAAALQADLTAMTTGGGDAGLGA